MFRLVLRQGGSDGELAESGPGRQRVRRRSGHTIRESGWHGRSCIRRGTPSALSAFKVGHCGPKFHLLSRVQSEFNRAARWRSEEHTSELQSPDHLVCRLLLEKKKRHKKA